MPVEFFHIKGEFWMMGLRMSLRYEASFSWRALMWLVMTRAGDDSGRAGWSLCVNLLMLYPHIVIEEESYSAELAEVE